MTVLQIKGKSIQIDIESELREYDFGYNARWTSNKLVASSPFRSDNRASFFVNLNGEYAGTWADSGALEYEYARGNFVSLIAKLRGITYEEAGDYLLKKYGSLYEIKPDEPIRIPSPKLRSKFHYTYIEDNPIIEATSPYLLSRGISAETQAMFGVGYDEAQPGFTAIPWTTEGGRLANIMYRSTRGKYFFYADGGTPIKRLMFGIDKAKKSAVLVEGVIDAMSWQEAGYSAIAVGGAYLSHEQAEIIKRSKIRRLYLGGDNDGQGRKLNRQAAEALRGYVELFEVNYGIEKDANDVLRHNGANELRSIYEQAERVNVINPIHLRI